MRFPGADTIKWSPDLAPRAARGANFAAETNHGFHRSNQITTSICIIGEIRAIGGAEFSISAAVRSADTALATSIRQDTSVVLPRSRRPAG